MSFFQSFFSRSPQKVIGIDVGSSSIKAVELINNKGTIILSNYGSIALGLFENLAIGQAIKPSAETVRRGLTALIEETQMKTKEAYFSIPFGSSLISIIKIPRVSESRISSVVPYEARKYIPVPMDSVHLDWFVIPDATLQEKNDSTQVDIDKDNNKIHVLLIAIHNHELARLSKVAKSLNITPSFEIEIFSTLRSSVVRNFYPILVMDVGARITKFYIVQNNIPLQSYSINSGSQTMTDAIARSLNISFKEAEEIKRLEGLETSNEKVKHALELVLNEITQEGTRVISSYEQKNKVQIEKIITSGGGSILKGFHTYVEKKLNIKIERCDPFATVEASPEMHTAVRDIGPEFAVAVGAALRFFRKE